MEAFLRNDYKFSVNLEYQLDPKILSLPLNVTEMHRHLKIVNQKLVQPLTLELKKLMSEFSFATEAELFASDLRYKFCDDSLRNVYHNEYPQKHEDLMERLKSKLAKTIAKFQKRFAELVSTLIKFVDHPKEPFGVKDTNIASTTQTKEQQLKAMLGLSKQVE
jgi:hypothetical protein